MIVSYVAAYDSQFLGQVAPEWLGPWDSPWWQMGTSATSLRKPQPIQSLSLTLTMIDQYSCITFWIDPQTMALVQLVLLICPALDDLWTDECLPSKQEKQARAVLYVLSYGTSINIYPQKWPKYARKKKKKKKKKKNISRKWYQTMPSNKTTTWSCLIYGSHPPQLGPTKTWGLPLCNQRGLSRRTVFTVPKEELLHLFDHKQKHTIAIGI